MGNGSDKRRVRRSIKQLQRVKTWQLIILLLLAGFVAATFLRLNNIGMIERRNAVITADESGDAAVITQRLYDLQRYVSGHMNTDLGRGVYLESSFSRDLQKWQADQYGDTNPNGNVYAEVQKICEPQFRSYSTAYLQCTTSELAKYPPSQTTASESIKPRSDTYIQAFASPTWSPDFAGWSLVVCALLALIIIVRLIALGVLSLMLRHHYRDA
jgi:hypothetical protein